MQNKIKGREILHIPRTMINKKNGSNDGHYGLIIKGGCALCMAAILNEV